MLSLVFFSKSFSIMNWIPYSGEGAETGQRRGSGLETAHVQKQTTEVVSPTFLGSMLNFFRPMATCLFLCIFFLESQDRIEIT